MRWGIVGALLATAAWSAHARAAEPRDYFLNAPTPGTFAHSDAYTVGVQQSIEDRRDLEPGMSMLHTRLSGILSYPYAEGSLNLDARVFLFTLGGSVGYRQVYRDLTFAPGDVNRSRDVRRERESAGDYGSQGFAFGEGRLRLVVPLGPLFMVNSGTIRWEDRNDNSFDWFHANVHDHGRLVKYEATLFYRHRDFGGLGPYLRVMNLPRENAAAQSRRVNEVHYGLVFATRPGFIRAHGGNTDLFLFQAVFKLGDQDYGLHAYRVPAYLLAVYRATLRLF
jgi:hypothetical protein